MIRTPTGSICWRPGSVPALLPGLGSRHDLSLLMEEMLGELCPGHVYVSGGDGPTPRPQDRIAGANYSIDNDRHKFAKIYRGESWNPDLRAPLAAGGRRQRGEYLLAVNGKELKARTMSRLFEGTAGKQTVLKGQANRRTKRAQVARK